MKILGFTEEYLDSVRCRLTLHGAMDLAVCESVFSLWPELPNVPIDVEDGPDSTGLIGRFASYDIVGWLCVLSYSRRSCLMDPFAVGDEIEPFEGISRRFWGEGISRRFDKLSVMSTGRWRLGDYNTSRYTDEDWKFITRCVKAVIIKASKELQ